MAYSMQNCLQQGGVDMGWGSTYIPDLTERFPEGFDGVDMTDSYYPSLRGYSDPWAYLDEEYTRCKSCISDNKAARNESEV